MPSAFGARVSFFLVLKFSYNSFYFNMVTIIRNYQVDFSNHVDEMGDNLSLSVGNTIEFGYKIIHNQPTFHWEVAL